MLDAKATKYSYEKPIVASAGDYFELMKPRVMSLVVFTGFCGLKLAPGYIHPFIAFCALLFISMGAGSAAAINMWYDRDIDSIMKRTQKRPTVTGIIEHDEALAFGIVTGVMSVLLMSLCVNLFSAFLLAFTILYYVFIYTIWLKRSSDQNVVIGGVSGALPPVIGWASVTGDISLGSISLFLIIFLWTPPHSWALALFQIKDYTNCNVPMMPVSRGRDYTKKQILLYTIPMIISTYLPIYFGLLDSYIYIFAIMTMGLVFLNYVLALFKDNDLAKSKKLFWYSIIYLFVIFLLLIIL